MQWQYDHQKAQLDHKAQICAKFHKYKYNSFCTAVRKRKCDAHGRTSFFPTNYNTRGQFLPRVKKANNTVTWALVSWIIHEWYSWRYGGGRGGGLGWPLPINQISCTDFIGKVGLLLTCSVGMHGCTAKYLLSWQIVAFFIICICIRPETFLPEARIPLGYCS